MSPLASTATLKVHRRLVEPLEAPKSWEPVDRKAVVALADAFDDSRMHDAHTYPDRRVDRSRDSNCDLRALDVIDDALTHLRTR